MNPFVERSIINDPQYFFGRKNEIRQIINFLQKQNSISVVGDRRIGKSSLLYHIFQKGNEYLNDKTAEQYHFMYIDCQSSDYRSLEGFVKKICKEIDYALFTTEELETNPSIILNDALDVYAKKKKLILLIDEFEKWTELKDIFNDNFIENLRSRCNEHKLTLITSSMSTLKDLTLQGNLTSPFFNIFHLLELKEFTVEEASQFIITYWVQGTLDPNQEETQLLFRLFSLHPLVLQIVSYRILDNREANYTLEELLRKIESDVSYYFYNHEEKIKRWTQKELPKKAKQVLLTTAWIGENIKNISPLKGLLSPSEK